jgi:hypothetical protein
MAFAPALSEVSAIVRLTTAAGDRSCRRRYGVCGRRSSCPVDATGAAGRRSLDRLTVDHAGAGLMFAPLSFAVDHQCNVMDGLEQQPPHEPPEPPVDCLPGRKVDRQHPPFAIRTNHVSDGIEDLPKIPLSPPARCAGRWHQRFHRRPFRIGQVAGISLRLLRDLGHPAPALICPHYMRESRLRNKGKLS